MARRILWQKWRDPLEKVKARARDVNEADPDAVLARASRSSFSADEIFDDDEEDGPVGVGPCLVGPQGVVPLHEENAAGRLYNLWLGHTNFVLSAEVVKAMCDVPGVESLDVFSPYRFRLGVGLAFEVKLVKDGLERDLLWPEQKKRAFGSLRKMASRGRKHWAVAVLPCGGFEAASGETEQEVREKVGNIKAEQVVASWQ